MTYIVEVTYDDYDDVSNDDLFGPFRTRETADAFAERVRAAVPSDQSLDRAVSVMARWVQTPRIRPIQREARRFLEDEV